MQYRAIHDGLLFCDVDVDLMRLPNTINADTVLRGVQVFGVGRIVGVHRPQGVFSRQQDASMHNVWYVGILLVGLGTLVSCDVKACLVLGRPPNSPEHWLILVVGIHRSVVVGVCHISSWIGQSVVLLASLGREVGNRVRH